MFTRKPSVSAWLNSYTRGHVDTCLQTPDKTQPISRSVGIGLLHRGLGRKIPPYPILILWKKCDTSEFFRFLFLQVLQGFYSFRGVGTLLCVFYELTVSGPREMVLEHFSTYVEGLKGFWVGLRDSVLTRLVLSYLVVRLG